MLVLATSEAITVSKLGNRLLETTVNYSTVCKCALARGIEMIKSRKNAELSSSREFALDLLRHYCLHTSSFHSSCCLLPTNSSLIERTREENNIVVFELVPPSPYDL